MPNDFGNGIVDDPEDLKQVGKKLTYYFQQSNASTTSI